MAEQPSRLLSVLAALIMAAATAAGLYFVAQAQRPAAAQTDIRYAPESEKNRLDLYLPAGDGPFPYVIDIHGGDFTGGDKSDTPVPEPLLDLGIAVVRVNYRPAAEAKWPGPRDDVVAAARFLRTAGPQFGLDPARYALWGKSAGGFLAVTAGLELTREGQAPRAIVDFGGPMAFGQLDADMAALDRVPARGPADAADSPESLLLGFPIAGNRAKADEVGPIGVLSAWPAGQKLPPLMIRHADGDLDVPQLQSGRLRDAWIAADPSALVDFVVVQGVDPSTTGLSGEDTAGEVAVFLAERLQ
ncbi:alpha/beta hydrolase [Tabrizicola sp. J26]|uniref:alpha/beta hydrolase fold domain-containing protein n=1 Tax=Alitabrizicola rongguiensis TaxID=2909234 RepID=UPI001F4242DF|nr:alpha/beta hydrolase [Tabrizicola rongguiensis]MCF1708917.1 alpha/beta hydrolase [Tabrizicola rongguiensis]